MRLLFWSPTTADVTLQQKTERNSPSVASEVVVVVSVGSSSVRYVKAVRGRKGGVHEFSVLVVITQFEARGCIGSVEGPAEVASATHFQVFGHKGCDYTSRDRKKLTVGGIGGRGRGISWLVVCSIFEGSGRPEGGVHEVSVFVVITQFEARGCTGNVDRSAEHMRRMIVR